MADDITRMVHRAEFPLASRTRLQLKGFTRALTAGPLRSNLHQALGHNRPMCELWYEAIDELVVDVDVFIVGTGYEIPGRAVHVATWQDGPYVWHVFVEYPVQAEVTNA